MSLIHHFWPFIKIYVFMGHFPLRLNGENQFISYKKATLILRYFTGLIITSAMYLGFSMADNLSKTDILQNNMESSQVKSTYVDIFAQVLGLFGLYFISFMITYNNLTMKDNMADFLNCTQSYAKSKSITEKISLYLIIFFLKFSILAFIFVFVYQYLESCQWSEPFLALFYGIFIFSWSLWIHGPTITATITITESFNRLKCQMNHLKQDVVFPESCHKSVLKRILDLYQDVLLKFNPIFSKSYTALTGLVMGILIPNFYLGISFLFGLSGNAGVMDYITLIGIHIYSLSFVFLMVLINFQAHKTMDIWNELLQSMLQINPNIKVQVQNDHGRFIEYSRQDLLEYLQYFHGFDCCGFFQLGKPLLTSVLATFATYMIILVQFKIS